MNRQLVQRDIMSRIACVFTLITVAAITASRTPAQAQTEQGRPSIAIEADKGDGPATTLADALREELRRSKEYRLADGPPSAGVIIHLVGLAIPNCRPANAVAVSYVSAPTEKHLGTAVLITTPSRMVASARDVLAKLQQMWGDAERR